VYILVKVPLIVEVKVIIPQQYASVQPLGIIKDVTCIPEGVGDGVGDDIGEGVGDGLEIGLVVVGVELVVIVCKYTMSVNWLLFLLDIDGPVILKIKGKYAPLQLKLTLYEIGRLPLPEESVDNVKF